METLLWYSSSRCVTFSPALSFTAGLTLNFTLSNCRKVYRSVEKRTKASSRRAQTVWERCSRKTFFSWIPGSVVHSRDYGAVKMWPVCSELLCVTLCIHYAFIKRTNWPYRLSVFVCINSLLYSFLFVSIYLSHSTGSRLLFLSFFFNFFFFYWIRAQPVGIITV